ncbi:Putative Sirtuin family, DHS-like NAD/FAD-binding domain superfamily [Septoria linicola]|uniref:Sirtuin family, DHS-like NAD/FAD-binding domain superfamily n=1 Tax=Septoria linicola TaxID=215465 RepID=A0A9Q9ADS1_9PEZI|nr:Putative Sirtuin family, DHS-like NAD/FAD-binding domain superfamily [Septoria linicola]
MAAPPASAPPPPSSVRLSSPLSSAPPSSRSCSPLSELSRSPTPPEDIMRCRSRSRANSAPYPSPPASQQTSQSGSPVPDGGMSSDKDGPPPAKRRRISEKAERTTEYLDLRHDTIDPEQQHQLDRLVNVLHRRQKIVVIAGAGISVSAGIPDFRSSQGLFRSLKEEYNLKGSGKDLFDASVYKDDVSTSSFHNMVNTMSRLTKDAKPTVFHHMLATIAQEDRLLRLYSQNVDGIDTGLEPLQTAIPLAKGANGKWPRTVQVHGGLDKMVCSKCHDLADLDPSLFDGPVPPTCPRCVEVNDIRVGLEGKRSHGIGRMRPRMVLYNEHNPDDEAIGAVTKDDLRKRPDAVIVVGTTLKVPGVRRIVREMCATVRDRRGGVAIWINSDPPPISKDLEDCWDIIVQGPCDNVAKHAAMRRWDVPATSDEYAEISEGEAKKTAAKKMRVQLPPSHGLLHAPKVERLSVNHRNNSFRPVSIGEMTPQKCMDHGPADWSPMSTVRSSVVPSIESGIDGIGAEAIDSTVSGLLTPTKSARGSPVKKLPWKVSSFPDLKDKSNEDVKKQQASKGTKKPSATKSKKSANVKPLPAQKADSKAKTAKSAPKATGRKTAPKPQGKSKRQASPKLTLKTSMGVSKTTMGNAKQARKEADNQITSGKSPSKLRHVTNASSEAMHALSPQDPRLNLSPPQSQEQYGKVERPATRMSISSITN